MLAAFRKKGGTRNLVRRIENRLTHVRQALSAVTEARAHAMEWHYREVGELLEFMQFILACLEDLNLVMRNIAQPRGLQEKALYLRVLVLQLYEFLEDYREIKSVFAKNQSRYFAGTDYQARLDKVDTRLEQLKRIHHLEFYSIRNMGIAHIEHDFEKRVAVIEGLDEQKILRVGGEISELISQLYGLLVPMMEQDMYDHIFSPSKRR